MLKELKESRKRLADMEFIQRCRNASLDELLVMLHNHKDAMEWKIIAIKRAIKKQQDRPESFVPDCRTNSQ